MMMNTPATGITKLQVTDHECSCLVPFVRLFRDDCRVWRVHVSVC